MNKALMWAVILLIVIGGGYWWYTSSKVPSSRDAGSTKPDTLQIGAENLQGKWKSTTDAKFERSFDSSTMTDWYSGAKQSSGTVTIFTKNSMQGITVPFTPDENAVYAHVVDSKDASMNMDYRIEFSPDANTLTMTYMEGSGTTVFAREPESLGTYGYQCDEHLTMSLTMAGDMSTITIAPTRGTFPATTTLSKGTATSGVLYQGSGFMIKARGESVSLTNKGQTLNCSPVSVPDMAPFNFGD